MSLKRRPELDQSVGAVIITKKEWVSIMCSRAKNWNHFRDNTQQIHIPPSVDFKLSSQDVKVIEAETIKKLLSAKCATGKCPTEKSIETGGDSNKSVDDPFQNEWKHASSGFEDSSDLNENILSKLSTDEIIIESPALNVQNSQNPTCRFRA